MKRTVGKKWLPILFMCIMCVFVMLPANQAQAASNKTKAIREYKKMLAKKTLKRDSATVYQTKNCRFALAYIDNNSIPELIVYNNKDASHIQGWGALYTYRKGKVRLVSPLTLDTRSRLGYYHKTGWFADNTTYQGYGGDTFQKLSGGKIKDDYTFSRSVEYRGGAYVITGYGIMSNGSYQEVDATAFNRALSYNTNHKKFKKFKFYKNTKTNRKKHLK